MANRDVPVHRWVPWIAGYSKYFVEDALARFTDSPGVVLDPFAGVGTTLVEADLAGHETVGFEINPYAAFAAQTKLKAHRADPDYLRNTVDRFMVFMEKGVQRRTKPRTAPPVGFRTRTPFYSPKVEKKVLLVLDFIADQDPQITDICRLAFAATMVNYSNYSYEPSSGPQGDRRTTRRRRLQRSRGDDEQGSPDGGRCRLVSRCPRYAKTEGRADS